MTRPAMSEGVRSTARRVDSLLLLISLLVATTQPAGAQQVLDRSVDLGLKRHLMGVGWVVADEPSCRSDVPVIVQWKAPDKWVDIASSTTRVDGRFSVTLPDRSGRYRVMAPEVSSRVCLGAMSGVMRHRH